MKTRALGHLIEFSPTVATAGCGDERALELDRASPYPVAPSLGCATGDSL